MSLHKALEGLRPKDFSEVPLDDLTTYLPEIFAKAELIANSVPPPPNGHSFEDSHRTRTDTSSATSAADLTVSQVRRQLQPQHEELHKAWGKPLKLSAKENATGISVFKMAGHDRHGAWFARTSVHEGLGFAKWKRAMMSEFPESLAVQGGPGEGNIRGIGGDKRLESIDVPGLGKLEVYQLSAQFPGPTSPREFITLLLTSENALSEDSACGSIVPRHYMVVSIPVTHPDAPPREGMVRGQYESVEMIREIPLSSKRSASTSNLLKHTPHKSRDRGSTIGFAESRGVDAKGEKIDRQEDTEDEDAETNPVEWIMITRSDPGGGIPRFMVERNTPSSIVQDAGKFLDWACSKDFSSPEEEPELLTVDTLDIPRESMDGGRAFSIAEANGILAGVGTSIVDNPRPASFRRPSQRTMNRDEAGILESLANTVEPYVPSALNPLHRRSSHSSSTSTSSLESFASAEQFNTAPEGLPIDDSIPTPSTISETSVPISASESGNQAHQSRELEKIEQKRQQMMGKLNSARDKQGKETQDASTKTAKELERATEKHNRERKKYEDKYAREIQKLEARRERETKKLLARQQKEADKNNLQKAQRERDEWKQRAELAEQENKLLKEQIGELQRENTVLVARMGKTAEGIDILKKVREELDGKGRKRASSRASAESRASKNSAGKGSEHHGHQKHDSEHSKSNLSLG